MKAEKLYEILVSYEDSSCELIKLPKEKIENRIKGLITQSKHGRLYIIEIDTLIGTALVNNPENVICYYDQPALADIVIKNNKLNLSAQPGTTFYIENTIKELVF